MVDSGATGRFIDSEYVKSRRIATCTLSCPIPVFNVDGTPNNAGAITEVVDCILRFENHTERTLFYVTCLGKEHLILGHSWLSEHNPEIDWKLGKVNMMHCSSPCSTCHSDAKLAWLEQKSHTHGINACQAGPFPETSESHDEREAEMPHKPEGEEEAADDSDNPLLEDGD